MIIIGGRSPASVVLSVAAAAVILTISGAATVAAQTSDRSVALPNTEYREFTSKVNARTYALYVALPDSYRSDASKRYPVLYVTDAQAAFALVTATYRLLRLSSDVPELIIVGIDSQDPAMWGANRFHDLTPTRNVAREAEMAKLLRGVTTGGGAAFLRVVTEELFPDIEKRYRATDDRSFVGHSLGGLFGAYCAFQSPSAFRRLILISPALYWDDTVIFKIEEKYAAANKALRARLFVSAGGLEPPDGVATTRRLVSVLADRHYEGLEVHGQIFEDETHTSVALPTMSRALRTLFKTPAAQ